MNIKKNIIIGLVASFVPLMLMSFTFDKNKTCYIDGFNYLKIVKQMPIMFVIINIILLPLLSKLNIKNYYIIGAILSVVYSSIGRYNQIPQNLFKMDPNIFQLKAVVLWTLFYGLFIDNLVN